MLILDLTEGIYLIKHSYPGYHHPGYYCKTGLFTLMLDGVISSLIGRSTPVRVHAESLEWKDVDLVIKIATG